MNILYNGSQVLTYILLFTSVVTSLAIIDQILSGPNEVTLAEPNFIGFSRSPTIT
jgi:hypothetical protein